MAAAVFAGLFLLAGIISIIVALVAMPKTKPGKYGKNTEPNYSRRWVLVAAPVLIVLAPMLFFLSGINSVPVKSVGVVTSFGKVGAEYGPGGHWLPPWKSLNIVQDTIQSDSFTSDNGDGPDQQLPSGTHGNCITIRLGGMNQGCADVQLQTQVIPAAIPELYANYSSYGPNLTQDVDQFVVKRELRTDLNRVLGDYNVIADVAANLTQCVVTGQNNCSAVTSSQFSQFDPLLLKALQQDPELKGKVSVMDINLQNIGFSQSTEDAIKKIQTAYLATVEATQQEHTNAAISLANAALVKQKDALTPAVLENMCFVTTQDAIKAGYPLPAGWSCSGSGSNLILPGK